MAIRSPHGRAAELGSGPRVEVLPADELPTGVPAEHPDPAGEERGPDGRFRPGNSRLSAKGGRVKKNRVELARSLGIEDLTASDEWKPYLRSAEEFIRAELRHLQERIGAGDLPPSVSAMVVSSAWQLAASRFLNAHAVETGNHDLFTRASALANAARQNALASHELAARAARDRRQQDAHPFAIDADAKEKQ